MIEDNWDCVAFEVVRRHWDIVLGQSVWFEPVVWYYCLADCFVPCSDSSMVASCFRVLS